MSPEREPGGHVVVCDLGGWGAWKHRGSGGAWISEGGGVIEGT